MSNIDFDRFLRKLSAASERSPLDPRRIEWPAEVDPDSWYFSPELISLYGTPVWEAMSARERKRLSLCEAANFFSLNIHGEKYLIGEIRRRLVAGDDSELTRYLSHFIAEEARHMAYFSEFCERYAGKIYPDRSVRLEAGDDRELDRLLLFARIYVFEEIVDHYNRTMARDERLTGIAREINRMHHAEEVRHLAFGRRFLMRCVHREVNGWSDSMRAELHRQLAVYLEFVWTSYCNPDVYRDAGIDSPFEVWQATSTSTRAAAHRAAINRKRLGFLDVIGLLEAT